MGQGNQRKKEWMIGDRTFWNYRVKFYYSSGWGDGFKNQMCSKTKVDELWTVKSCYNPMSIFYSTIPWWPLKIQKAKLSVSLSSVGLQHMKPVWFGLTCRGRVWWTAAGVIHMKWILKTWIISFCRCLQSAVGKLVSIPFCVMVTTVTLTDILLDGIARKMIRERIRIWNSVPAYTYSLCRRLEGKEPKMIRRRNWSCAWTKIQVLISFSFFGLTWKCVWHSTFT